MTTDLGKGLVEYYDLRMKETYIPILNPNHRMCTVPEAIKGLTDSLKNTFRKLGIKYE